MTQRLQIDLERRWAAVSTEEWDQARAVIDANHIASEDYVLSGSETDSNFSFALVQGEITDDLRDQFLEIFRHGKVNHLDENKQLVMEIRDRVLGFRIEKY